jgi:hypothetical protein
MRGHVWIPAFARMTLTILRDQTLRRNQAEALRLKDRAGGGRFEEAEE